MANSSRIEGMGEEPRELVYRVDNSAGLNAPGATFNEAVSVYISRERAAAIAAEPQPTFVESTQPPFGRLPEHVRGREGILDSLALRPAVHVLCGMGGIGKTTIALQATAMARIEGCRVFWIDASSATRMVDALGQVALAAGAPEADVARAWRDPGKLAADLMWNALEQWDHKWMLVFDRADDLGNITCPGTALRDGNGWVRPPTANGNAVMVTTRDSSRGMWSTTMAEVIDVKLLESPSGGAVLRDLARDAGSSEDAQELANRLGCLPLALHLAGSYLAQAANDPTADARSFRDYMKLIASALFRLDEPVEAPITDHRDPDAQARDTIAGTWELSLTLLERRGLVHARAILRLLSCFSAGTPLPHTLINANLIASAPVWPESVEAHTIKRCLQGLRSVGLLEVANELEGPTYQLHPLVAEVSRYPLTTDPEEYRDLWATACLMLLEATPNSAKDPTLWPAWRLLAPHWQCLIEILPAGLDVELITAVVTVASFAISYYRSRADYPASNKIASAVLRHAESASEEASLAVRYQVGLVHRDSGDLRRAERDFRRLIREYRRVFGTQHQATASVRYELAAVLHRRGQYLEAKKEFDRTLPIERRKLGAFHHSTLITRHDRAVTLRALGQFAESEHEIRIVLDAYVRLLGKDHLDTLTARHELAVVLRDRNELTNSLAEFRKVLSAERDILGDNHPSTLQTRFNVANTLALLGNFRAAEHESRVVLSGFTEALGAEHPETLRAHQALTQILMLRGGISDPDGKSQLRKLLDQQGNQLVPSHQTLLEGREHLAVAMWHEGELNAAFAEYDSVSKLYSETVGPDNPLTVNSREHRAAALLELARYSEATAEIPAVVEAQRKLHGDLHPNTLSAQRLLAIARWREGSLEQAEHILQNIVYSWSRLPDANTIGSLEARHDLAAVRGERGHWKEAAAEFREILTIEISQHGEAGSKTTATRSNLAMALKEAGALDAAETEYRKALSIIEEVHGPTSYMSIQTRHNLAVVMRLRGNLDAAVDEHRKNLAIERKSVSADHPLTLNTRKGLARVLQDRGLWIEADVELRAVLKDLTRTLGPRHPMTLSTRGNIAEGLIEQDRLREAEREYRLLRPIVKKVLGINHPEATRVDHNLAFAISRRGRLSEAEARFRNLCAARSSHLGPTHHETLASRGELARVLYQRGKTDVAENTVRQIIADCREALGTSAEETLFWRTVYGRLLSMLDRPAEAQRELRDVEQLGVGLPPNSRVPQALQSALEFSAERFE